MGSLSNNSRKLANFAGFYKGIQSAGAAGMWRLDAELAPYMTEFASCWGLLLGSLLIASPVIFTKVKDSTDVAEDLRFSDETAADVMGDATVNMNESEKPHSPHQENASAEKSAA